MIVYPTFVCMKVTEELIQHLAYLARLDYRENERAALKPELEKMIAFVEKLEEVNTAGVEPLLYISEQVNVLREDEIQGSLNREEALSNAPLRDDAFFKVPKVIKK